MNNIVKIKIGLVIIFAPLSFILGAYFFTIGNRELAKAFFIFGLINLIGGFAWLIIHQKRVNKK